MKMWLGFILFLITACNLKSENHELTSHQYVPNINNFEIKYAKGFEIIQNDSVVQLNILSLSTKYPFFDSLCFPKIKLSMPHKSMNEKWSRIACQSSTHAIFTHALNQTEKIVGLCDMAFMPKDSLFNILENLNVKELNKNGTVNTERLLSTLPDIFLIYPFELNSKKYEAIQVKTLLIPEYLEQTPLARLEWIKCFGLLLDKVNLAHTIFNRVDTTYQSLKVKTDTNKTVFFNLPFKDEWFMPATQSITVNLAKDAGFNYIYDNGTQNSADNLTLSKEYVWNSAINAEYWVIIAHHPNGFSLLDLTKEDPIYNEFTAVKKKQVIYCNTSKTSYFTTGILEPDMMLKDLLFLTGQLNELNYTPKYFHFLK